MIPVHAKTSTSSISNSLPTHQQRAIAARCQLVADAIKWSKCKAYLGKCPFPQLALYHYLLTDCEEDFKYVCLENPEGNCSTKVDHNGFVNLSYTVSLCDYSYTLANGYDGTAKAQVVLQQNSFDQKARLTMLAFSNCGEDDIAIESSPFRVYTSSVMPGIGTFANGFITHIRLYTSSTSSTLFDVSPTSTAFWNTCSNCVAVNPLDLKFSSPNFITAFTQQLKNVAATIFGEPASDNLGVEVSWLGPPFYVNGTLQISTAIKHKGTKFLVINPADFTLMFSTGNIADPPVLVFNGVNHYTFLDSLPVFPSSIMHTSAPCSTTLAVGNTSPYNYSLLNHTATSFDNIVLNNGGLSAKALTLSPTSSSCTVYTLKAAYSLPPTIVSKGWYDASDTLVSTADVYTTSVSGPYTFKIQSSVLPLITKTIVVS